MAYVVSFSGTQKGMTLAQEIAFSELVAIIDADYIGKIEFHHGDDKGADSDADAIVRNLGNRWEVHLHIPTDRSRGARCEQRGPTILYPPKSFLSRNKDIVKPADILISTPSGPEILRSGTWSTIRYAEKRNKKIIMIMPDGEKCQERNGIVTRKGVEC